MLIQAGIHASLTQGTFRLCREKHIPHRSVNALHLVLCMLSMALITTQSKAQSVSGVDVTVQVAPDGNPNSLSGPSTCAATNPWTLKSCTQSLQFGQDFNFNLQNTTQPQSSAIATLSGGASRPDTIQLTNQTLTPLYVTKTCQQYSPWQENEWAFPEGWPNYTYSPPVQVQSGFALSTVNTGCNSTLPNATVYRDIWGTTQSAPLQWDERLREIAVTELRVSGEERRGLTVETDYPQTQVELWSNDEDCSLLANCEDLANYFTAFLEDHSIHHSRQLNNLFATAQDTELNTPSVNAVDTEVQGYIEYSAQSLNGANSLIINNTQVSGIIGRDVIIGEVKVRVDGIEDGELELWLKKGNTSIRIFNQHFYDNDLFNGVSADTLPQEFTFVDNYVYHENNNSVPNNEIVPIMNDNYGVRYENNPVWQANTGTLNLQNPINDVFQNLNASGEWILEAYDVVGTQNPFTATEVPFWSWQKSRMAITHFEINFIHKDHYSQGYTSTVNASQTLPNAVSPRPRTISIDHDITGACQWYLVPPGSPQDTVTFELTNNPLDLSNINWTYEQLQGPGDWQLIALPQDPLGAVLRGEGITSFTLTFNDDLLDPIAQCPGRPFAGRVFPSHLTPDCTNPNNHFFYQPSGYETATELTRMIGRFPDNPELNAGNQPVVGLKIVPMGNGVFDAYDLANDLHYTAVRINGESVAGHEIRRSSQDSLPLLTAVWETMSATHAANDTDPFALPTSTNLKGIKYASTTAPDPPTCLALSDAQFANATSNWLYDGSNSWLSSSAFQSEPTLWEEWLVVVPDTLGKLDLLDSATSIYFNQAWSNLSVETQTTDTSSNYVNTINLAQLDTNQLNSLRQHQNLLADNHWSGSVINQIDLRGQSQSMWRNGADVQTFYSSQLNTYYEQGSSFELGKIHISYPITAPKYDNSTYSNVPYNGADAISNQLPYWGIPNGIQGYAKMLVQIENKTTNTVFTKEIDNNAEPLMLKDCPFLIQDSIRMEVSIQEMINNSNNGFGGGDEVEISAMVFWSTPARRTALWSYQEPHNREILCTNIQNFTMTDGPAETSGSNASSVTVAWNEGVKSTGGYMRLQRRNALHSDSLNGGWFYINNSGQTTSNRNDARVWRNTDADNNGSPDPITYNDNDLPHTIWECQRVEYRVEQDMCGVVYYTPAIGVNITGSLQNPWVVDGQISNGINVSEGQFPSKVNIDWSTATDPSGNIHQFRVYRRLYQPAAPNAINWQQIFSTEDDTWYNDYDIAAGVLYEYRVGAVMTCTNDTGQTNTVQLQEFWAPAPHNIGFRSSMGSISGEILFENNSPSGGVRIEATPQSSTTSRNSLKLGENEYLSLHLDSLTAESQSVWPDMSLSTNEWTISQWFQVPQTTLNFTEFPLVGLNIENPQTHAVREAFSIWGSTADADPGKFHLKFKQGGTSVHFTDSLLLEDDTYYHLSVNIISQTNTTPQMRLQVSVLPDQVNSNSPLVGTAVVQGSTDQLNEIRNGWHSITWNAASVASPQCGDPFADNFQPLTIVGNQDLCSYPIQTGCTDNAIEHTFDPTIEYDAYQDEPGYCEYDSIGFGELISMRWFSDSSASAHEAPALFLMQGNQQGALLYNFHDDLAAVHASHPAAYPYSMPVLTAAIPPGTYRIRVLDNSDPTLDSLPDASNFHGNFSVYNDRGVNYVNCLQYHPTEVTDGFYDFTIQNGSCQLTGIAGTIDNLMTDCADCYSVEFDTLSTPYSLTTTDQGQNAIGNQPTFAFWFRAPTEIGSIFSATSTQGDTINLLAERDVNHPSNANGIKFRLTGAADLHSQFVEAPYNEYNLIPGQWYHATLHIGLHGSGSFILRSTDLNDSDAEPWNSTREFNFNSGISASIESPTGFTMSSLALGGTNTLIHNLSIWSGELTTAQSLELFQGIRSANLYDAATAFTNENGQWANTPSSSSSLNFNNLRSVLVPDNSGRFVDHMLGKQLYPQGFNQGRTGTEIFNINGQVIESGVPLGNISSERRSIRRAPWGTCNPGCARIFNACNFNPFANQHGECQLSCAGVTTNTRELVAHPVNYDEIRGWTGAPHNVLNESARVTQGDSLYLVPYTSIELANYWARKYPDNLTAGLFLMYDADESLGSIVYDRSKYSSDQSSWNRNNGQIMQQTAIDSVTFNQSAALPSGNYYSEIPANLPLSLRNWALSSSVNGSYIIPNIKFQGATTSFNVQASKTTDGFPHTFTPNMQIAAIGDANISAENRNFTDISAFNVDFDVFYQSIQSGRTDYSGTDTPSLGTCPVQGVRFTVDGVLARDSSNAPLETDANGRITLSLTRGNRVIRPILDHLNAQSTLDDHIFHLATPQGNTVNVTGHMTRSGGEGTAPFNFIDITTRRAVGRVIGGNEQAAQPWGDSRNNLGIATFQLVQESSNNVGSTILINTCPAVRVTTDTLGQYDVQLLPAQYRIATAGDSDSENSNVWNGPVTWTGFEVDGWRGYPNNDTIANTNRTWASAFAEYIKDNADDQTYTSWDMTSKQSWNQSQMYPNYPSTGNQTYLPSDAYQRRDLIFEPEPELSVRQLVSTNTNNNSAFCNITNPALLPDSLSVFLGESELIVRDASGDEYISPLMHHLIAHQVAVSDTAINNVDLVPPFPLGLPIIQTGRQYCAAILAMRRYEARISSLNYIFRDTAAVFGNNYMLSIDNTLSNASSTTQTISLTAGDQGTAYGFTGGQPTRGQNNGIPTGNLRIQLHENGNVRSTWNPFSSIMGEDPVLTEVPGLLLNQTDTLTGNSIGFRTNRFDAIILGFNENTPPVPVSSDPELDFILRDPPGDQSYCKIEQNSTFSFERTVESGNQNSATRARNLELVPSIDLSASVSGGAGISFGVGAGTSVDAEAGIQRNETYTRSSSGEMTIREEMSATQVISTSNTEQSFNYGNNQDLFYGTVRNTSIGLADHFRLIPAPDAIRASLTQSMIEDYIHIDTNSAPVFHFTDTDNDGIADFPMLYKRSSTTGLIIPDSVAYFTFAWSTIPAKAMLPASHFMKTEYTIENVDIPMLEALRDNYFRNSGFYHYPTGQLASTQESALGWSYPSGMKYANNDDHRWELFHQNWMNTMSLNYPVFQDSASTLQRGYQVTGNIFTTATNVLLNAFQNIPQGTADPLLLDRIQTEAITGNDRIGPGYRFEVDPLELAAINLANGSFLSDIQLDSVRYYNNQIAAWKLILAENEFAKLNARQYIMNNVQSFSDPSTLQTWMGSLQQSGQTVNNWSLEDFSSIGANNGTIPAGELAPGSIWSEADFEPFFLNFSGGGGEFSNALTKTNITEQTRSRTLSGSWNAGENTGLLIGEAGLIVDESRETVMTETRRNTEGTQSSVNYTYVLSDNDEQDFYLVCVVPGRGLNGPIFLNLGSATSCPHVVSQPSDYSEWYPALLPTQYNITAQLPQCDSITHPVWNMSIPNASAIQLNTTQGSSNYVMTPLNGNNASTGSDSGVISLATGEVFSGQLANGLELTNGLVQASRLVPGLGGAASVISLAVGAWTGYVRAASAMETAAASTWRSQIMSDYSNAFSGQSQSAQDILNINLATEETELFLANGMCNIIGDPNPTSRAENTIIQPQSVALEVPRLTLTHNGISGLTSLNTTRLMTEGINLSFQLENATPNPYGGPSEYFLYRDATSTTLSADISLAGGSPQTEHLELQPNWSAGPYTVLGTIEHSGIEAGTHMMGHVDFIMSSVCDNNVKDTVRVNINFEPACSDLAIIEPLENWTANLNGVSSGAQTDSLQIAIDVARNNFKNWRPATDGPPIIVEYRTGNNSQWSTISPSPTLSLNLDSTMSDPTFNWNPLDGQHICNQYTPGMCSGYEGEVLIRASSQCANEFAAPRVSPIITGHVDYIRPELFGSVLPADGFYEPGDEIQLRWSEAMETTDPSTTLNPGNIEMWAHQNSDFTINTGGLQFHGQEHLTVLQSSNLDVAGWAATWSLWAGDSVPQTVAPGVIFCQGDHQTGSLSAELRSTQEIAIVYRAQGTISEQAILALPDSVNWRPGWNEFNLEMIPNGAGGYYVSIRFNGSTPPVSGPLNIPDFDLPSRRLTIGNGWSNSTAESTPLTLPMQNFRLWSSQRETPLDENGNFIITGQELGLQVFLPMDEMHGIPVERSRNRPILMEANWFGTHGASAIDFAGNTASASLRPQISGISFTPVGGRNTTVEFWVKPGGTNEAILGVNGSANPEIDTFMENWSFEINEVGNLIVANGADTLTSNAPLTDAWHHIALVRHNNGSVNLYVDGDNADSGAPYSHGRLQPSTIFIGERMVNPVEFDMPFTGKFDELRIWSTALPLNSIRERMRDGVYGYDNLVLHAPFEARQTATDTIAANQAYGYTLWDGYTSANDASSLSMPLQFDALSITNLDSSHIQEVDAPLMQHEPQQIRGHDVQSVSWNGQNDEVIIELNDNALYKYEDQLVTFRINNSNLKDAGGNSTADDLTFDLLIDRNPLKWGESSLEISGLQTTDLVLETTVVNVGNQNQYFEIAGLPTWLEASPTSGNISANSSIDVTFTVVDILPAGEYSVDAKLKGGLPCGQQSGFCYGERLTMDLDIYLQAPELSIDPTSFPHSIPMIAKVYKGNIASSNERDIVMAYVGDELRGFAQLDMVVADQNLAFLNVFFDEDADAGSAVTFRVWDAASGSIRALLEPHWPDLDSDPITISLSNDNPPPFSVFEPLLLRSTDKVEVQSELTPGWNWVSINVVNTPSTTVQSAFQTVRMDDIVQIKTHNEDKIFFSSNMWNPDAQDPVNPNMRYEVEMMTGTDTTWNLANIGSMADHLTFSQNLVTGWNDIGYIPHQVFAVEDALRSLADADTVLGFNDLMISRYDGFAVYVGDGHWVGSLETLEPGQGYRLYLDDTNGSASAGTLEWPASFAHTNPNFRTEGPTADGLVDQTDAADGAAGWPMNVQAMESSMAMVIRLELPSTCTHSTGDMIGAFALDQNGNEICVGQALPKDTESGLLYFLSVYKGNSTQSGLTFRWKSGISEVELIADEMMTFSPSMLTGNPTSPFLLNFTLSEFTPESGTSSSLVAYPNPFVDEITIHWHGQADVKMLSIKDANGRLISHLDCDGLRQGPCRWNASQLEPGVYFIHAITDDGKFAVRLIK